MATRENRWLGSNELVMFYRDGTFHVIEEYEGWSEVFTGTYEQARSYMDKREIAYLEATIG